MTRNTPSTILESRSDLIPLVCATSYVPPTAAVSFSPLDCVTSLFLTKAVVVVGFLQCP